MKEHESGGDLCWDANEAELLAADWSMSILTA
jgi:hypothetical protein